MTALETTSTLASARLKIRLYRNEEVAQRLPALDAYVARGNNVAISRRPGWMLILRDAMKHEPFAIEAVRGEQTVGLLCVAYVRSMLFGRYLVGMPYVNTGGVIADDASAADALINRAVDLADELDVRFLELRHEVPHEHRSLGHRRSDKLHMRLSLPTSGAVLWEQISAKVRNQVRKAQKCEFTTHWGGSELLDDFYEVFSRNMRDLGTPTFGRGLFDKVINQFPNEAEFCVIRDKGLPISVALLLHGRGVTEVPSASSLKAYNSTCANMLLYWNLLERSAERRQAVFDFGRSSEGSSTYRFKKQWGASASPADWQYYLRQGSIGEMRPDNPKYRRLISIWKRLPVSLTRCLGPRIVRGIP